MHSTLVFNLSFLTKLLPNDIYINSLRAIGQDGIKFGIAQGTAAALIHHLYPRERCCWSKKSTGS